MTGKHVFSQTPLLASKFELNSSIQTTFRSRSKVQNQNEIEQRRKKIYQISHVKYKCCYNFIETNITK